MRGLRPYLAGGAGGSLLLAVACAVIGLTMAAGIADVVQRSGAQAADTPASTLPPATAAADGYTALTAEAGNAAACPVTRPPEPPFRPPAPYPPSAPYPSFFWYGSDALWTFLRVDGAWSGLPKDTNWYGQKVFWWRDGFDWRTEPQPAIAVTGRRLDDNTLLARASRSTHGWNDDLGAFMLIGVTLPTEGCWEITGRYGGTDLSFVVWVAP